MAKQYALANGKTFTTLVEEALREKLIGRQRVEKQPRIKLKTVGGKGVSSGVDLDDSAALLDILDE